MKTYCVSYDLNKSGKNYEALYEEIKSSPGWCHALDSTWFVSSPEDANQLSERLRKRLDEDDDLLVITVSSDYAGWLASHTWDWIGKHVKT
ncbi:hypothetical protein [Vibrio fortis]|jgi:hypothetical protein|uniref:hypothetical protein n=1 Tax=Vibrio fortis TaxID=212667 RepID=UPI0036F440F5